MIISRRTFEILKIAGWHPGRKIDCTGVLEFLKDKGFVINALIVSFLEEFGQLEFDIIHPQVDAHLDKHHTFAKKTIGSLKPSDFSYFETLFKERLIPIGEIFNRHLYLFISETGNVYTDLGLMGSGFMQAFENIFLRKFEKPLETTLFNPEEFNTHKLCIFTDKSMPEIMYRDTEENLEDEGNQFTFAAFHGVYGKNPSILPQKQLGRFEDYRDYYRFCLTDAGIDRILKENPDLLLGKEIEKIRAEMYKLRSAISVVREEAKMKKALALDGSGSFEIWPIEHCAEIWAARNAILSGIRFENIAFSAIRTSDSSILGFCNNCSRIFESNYKVKSM